MNMNNLSRIGLFEANDKIVGLATYESEIGESYFCLDNEYGYLKPQLIEYAMQNLSSNKGIKISIPDGDLEFQRAAAEKGFVAITHKSSVAQIDINNTVVDLPNVYKVISFIWRGFDKQRDYGDYAPHCGMWYIPNSEYAYIEPVFILPEYRKKRLGKLQFLKA